MLSSIEYEKRLSCLRMQMSTKGIDLLFVPASVNMRYVTGLAVDKTERLVAILVHQEEDPVIICPSFEVERLQNLVSLKNVHFLPWEEEEDPYKVIKSWLQTTNIQSNCTIGIESKSWFSEYVKLAKNLPKATYIDAGEIFTTLRLIKSNYEIMCIQSAISIIDEARNSLFANVYTGMRQSEARALLCYEAMKRGGVNPVWWGVYFGDNTSSAHGGNKEVVLEKGMVIMVDSGVDYQGYRSDITRTTCFYEASKEFEAVFRIVRDAQLQAIDSIKPGVTAEYVDSAARSVISKAGYGKYFTHRLGHGIGMEEHEPPWIGPGQCTMLKEGMVFTVEPGVYFPGRFGVRLEDIVVVTENGCEVLSALAKDFYPITGRG
jgi:Xaa-Pro dipeptidase